MFHLCTKCVMPSTKPDLSFDEQGVCNACQNFAARARIDWTARAAELRQVVEKFRSRDESNWDCLVPVSGGKDSHFQVIKMLQLGLNPLCVTASTCRLSAIGRRNLDNIRTLGVDHLEFSTNALVRRKLNRIGLRQVGDISWPEHVSIFTIPVRVAVQYRVPLIIWGENPQHEYGGPAAAVGGRILDRRWLEEFGGLLGLRVSDLAGQEGLRPRELLPFTYPGEEELRAGGITGLFLGYFLPWDGFTNALIAENYGFEVFPTAVEGAALDYENVDNLFHGIHDYFKYLKYGFARATDHVCMQIRRERLSREDALAIVARKDAQFPWSYLGVPLAEILRPIEIAVEEFAAICDRFTNKRLFRLDGQGRLLKNRDGSPVRLEPEPFRPGA